MYVFRCGKKFYINRRFKRLLKYLKYNNYLKK